MKQDVFPSWYKPGNKRSDAATYVCDCLRELQQCGIMCATPAELYPGVKLKGYPSKKPAFDQMVSSLAKRGVIRRIRLGVYALNE